MVAAGRDTDGEQARALSRRVRIADVTGCVVLFLVQAGLGLVALLSFMAFPMSTDSCAYRACGDEKWIGYAMWTAVASLVPAAVFFCVGYVRLTDKRIGFWWLLIGVLAQGGILAAAWRMAVLAGPVDG
ncbi:hypothetical protein [Mycolicibacterium sp.]|uniref:hypothetical protein n=1 Tax=Mycolicibacterium sp. TaxID=2320850 RepID=UPI0037CB0DA8